METESSLPLKQVGIAQAESEQQAVWMTVVKRLECVEERLQHLLLDRWYEGPYTAIGHTALQEMWRSCFGMCPEARVELFVRAVRHHLVYGLHVSEEEADLAMSPALLSQLDPMYTGLVDVFRLAQCVHKLPQVHQFEDLKSVLRILSSSQSSVEVESFEAEPLDSARVSMMFSPTTEDSPVVTTVACDSPSYVMVEVERKSEVVAVAVAAAAAAAATTELAVTETGQGSDDERKGDDDGDAVGVAVVPIHVTDVQQMGEPDIVEAEVGIGAEPIRLGDDGGQIEQQGETDTVTAKEAAREVEGEEQNMKTEDSYLVDGEKQDDSNAVEAEVTFEITETTGDITEEVPNAESTGETEELDWYVQRANELVGLNQKVVGGNAHAALAVFDEARNSFDRLLKCFDQPPDLSSAPEQTSYPVSIGRTRLREVALALALPEVGIGGCSAILQARLPARDAVQFLNGMCFYITPNEPLAYVVSRNDLASQLMLAGLYAEGAVRAREALSVARASLGPMHTELARALNVTAVICTADGSLAEAQALHEEALTIRKTLHGQQPNRDVASSLTNLGHVLRRQKKTQEALRLHEEALDLYRRIHPDEGHYDVGVGLNNVAASLQDQGRLEDATELYKRALQVFQSVYGDRHAEVARTLCNMGYVLCEQGRLSEAKTAYDRALEMRRDLCGDAHPDTARTLHSLEAVLRRMQSAHDGTETP